MTEEKSNINGGKKDTRIKPGEVRNPTGRPKGARSKFGEDFVREFAEHWAEHGKSVLDEAVKDDKAAYLRVACTILPKVIELGDETKEAITNALTQIPFDAIRSRKEAAEEQPRTTH